MKILICEDDPNIIETVSLAFSMRWPESQIRHATSGGAAIAQAAREAPDLMILDVNLPDMDGFQILETVRKSSQVPVIMLTVKASDRDKVRGLELGADDYVGKPFSPFELVARASAVLRRSGGGESSGRQAALAAGPLRLDPDTAEVFLNDQPIKLSPTEFKILELLLRNAGKVVARDTLLREVWGIESAASEAHLVKLHMQNLRKKLGDSGTEPKIVLTVRGFGYKVADTP